MIKIETQQNPRVALVSLQRDDGRNALSAAFMEEIRDTARALRECSDISVVVLAGYEGIFSAGADLKDRALGRQKSETLLEYRDRARLGPDMCQAWCDLDQIVICAFEGAAIGGGAALVVSTDIIIAGKSAYLRLPEIELGMNMSWRSVPAIVRTLGHSAALDFVVGCRALSAEDAHRHGLVFRLVDDGESLQNALKLADHYASMPPISVRMTKEFVSMCSRYDERTLAYMDRDQYLLAQHSEDQKEALRAWREKRKPDFKGN